MAVYPVTPNLGLQLPPVETPGTQWASAILANMTLIDAMNHTAGEGVQVPTAGLLIDADLAFNGFNAISLTSTQYTDQASTLPSSVIDGIYGSGGDLYWNNGSGTPVQITDGGSVVGGGGANGYSFSGSGTPFSGGAAANFTNTGVFNFFQATSQYAPVRTGRLTIFDDTTASTTSAITLITNPGSAAYALNFPSQAPVTTSTGSPTKFLMTTTAGQMSFIGNSANLSISAGSINVSGLTGSNLNPSANIAGAQLADHTITDLQIESFGITPTAIGACIPRVYGQLVSTSSGSAGVQSIAFTVAPVTYRGVTALQIAWTDTSAQVPGDGFDFVMQWSFTDIPFFNAASTTGGWFKFNGTLPGDLTALFGLYTVTGGIGGNNTPLAVSFGSSACPPISFSISY